VKLIIQPHRPHILYSCSVDCSIRLWDIRSGKLLKILTGHTDSILDFDVDLYNSYFHSLILSFKHKHTLNTKH
jgi:WD40 repeat protein